MIMSFTFTRMSGNSYLILPPNDNIEFLGKLALRDSSHFVYNVEISHLSGFGYRMGYSDHGRMEFLAGSRLPCSWCMHSIDNIAAF